MALLERDGQAAHTGAQTAQTDAPADPAALTVAPAPPPSREAAQALQMLLAELPGPWYAPFAEWELVVQGDMLVARPPELPELGGLKVLGAGLRLCRLGKGYVKPEHALAMAAPTSAFLRRQDLSSAQAARFLRGEALDSRHAGWTLVTWQGLPLGWGKAVQGQLKNHLPKGLRQR